MKKLAFILMSAAVLGMNTGCEKVQNLLSSFVKCTVDGTSFYATAASGSILSGRLTLTGSTTNASEIVNILVPATITPGTYTLSSIGSYTCQYKTGTINIYNSTSGELIITEHDTVSKKVKGTFNFTGVNASLDQVNVTAGQFTVTYI